MIHGLVHASVLLLPAVFGDLQREFGVSLLQVLAVANLMYLLFGLAAIPAGYLADRVGSQRMMTLAAAGCGLSLAMVALAPNFSIFTSGLVLLGLSAGVYHPCGLSLLSRGVAQGERGRAIGIHGVGGTLGEAVAPAWAALFAAHLGWRWGFAATGALSIFGTVLVATLPETVRRHFHGHSHGHGHSHSDGHTHDHELTRHGMVKGAALLRSDVLVARPISMSARLREVAATLRTFWQSRPLRWLLLSMVAGGFVYRGVLTFLPLHLADATAAEAGNAARGTAPSMGSTAGLFASYLTSAVLIAGVIAQRFGGELADRLPRERLFLAEVALFVPVLGLLGTTSGGFGLVVLALAFGFLWYLAQPLANAMTAAYVDTQDHGLLFGIQFAMTFGIGSFATTIGGLLYQRGGTPLAFLGFGAVAIAQLLGALALVASVRPRSIAAQTANPS